MNVIVLDTETTNSMEEPLVYDLGWAVVDLDTEETLLTRSYAIAEIYLDKPLMNTAYYASKLPIYEKELKAKERKLIRFENARKIFLMDCKKYGVTEVYAHNARFDNLSCNTTRRYLSGSKYRYFFPKNITICDTLKMARKALKGDRKYSSFCFRNDYLTENLQDRYTAEVLYRYFTGNVEFEEAHRGLEDVLIEKEILFECRKRGVTEGKLWDD